MVSSTKKNQVKNKNLRMVFFPSFKDLRKARNIMNKKNVSYRNGPGAFVVHKETVQLLRKSGISITHVLEPIEKSDLTTEQIEQQKKRKAHFCGPFFITLEVLDSFNPGEI